MGVRCELDLDHPEIPRVILAGIVETGDVIGPAGPRRTVLAVTVDDWLVGELAAMEAEHQEWEEELLAV